MLYKENETIKMLGNQYLNRCFSNEDVRNIREIIEAYTNEAKRGNGFDIDMLCIDCAMYGFLIGKRTERNRKKTGKKWLY